MELKQYPEYKEVKLPWINKLPLEWKVLRAKSIFKPIDIRSETGEEELLSVSEKKGVSPRKNINVTMFKAESYKGYKLCWPGDLVINSLWAWMQGLGFSKYHGIISTAYGVYRLKNKYQFEYKYFDYLLRSSAYLWELRVRSKGIWKSRYQLTDDAFMTMPVIIPSKSERRRIVRFLDSKCAQIAKFLRNKRRLIKLLKEQKQAIINQAVTRGIDPNEHLKPSGVDWLGDIPEHWKVLSQRRISKSVKTGGTPPGADEKYFSSDGFNWYTPSDFKDELYLEDSERRLSSLGKEYIKIFPPNTVMMIGIGGTIGKVSISKFSAGCNQQINGIIVNKEIKVEFLVYYLRFLKEYIVKCGKYTTLPIINQEETKNLPVLLPSAKEQKQIIKHIENESKEIDMVVSSIKREIDLVREYRKRLISDVVTGKLDVRNINVDNVSDVELIDDSSINEETQDLNDSIKEVSNEH